MHRRFPLSEILVIELETSSDRLQRIFEIKFDKLYDGQVDETRCTTLILREQPYLGLNSKRVLREITLPEFCLFDDQNFYVVRDQKRAHIPFEDIGIKRVLELNFEQGFPLDWIRRLMDDILAFHMAGRGVSFFHAACVTGQDCEIIIPAWRGSGKTGLVLYLLNNYRLEYKSEDQFLVDAHGRTYPYTDACHVDYKHVQHFPIIRQNYYSVQFAARSTITRILTPLFPPVNVSFELMRRLILKAFAPKVFIKLGEFIPGFKISHRHPNKKVLLQLVSQPDMTDIILKPTDIEHLVVCMMGGMQYERLDLYPFYYAWIYATGCRNQVIDNIHTIETDILRRAFAEASCWEVVIPVNLDGSGNFSKLIDMINQNCQLSIDLLHA